MRARPAAECLLLAPVVDPYLHSARHDGLNTLWYERKVVYHKYTSTLEVHVEVWKCLVHCCEFFLLALFGNGGCMPGGMDKEKISLVLFNRIAGTQEQIPKTLDPDQSSFQKGPQLNRLVGSF